MTQPRSNTQYRGLRVPMSRARTFSDRRRCERLQPGRRPGSVFCKVPSSRSPRLTWWRPRGSARSRGNFCHKARTRSPVGAVPFPWHPKRGRQEVQLSPDPPRENADPPARWDETCQAAAARPEKTRIPVSAVAHVQRCGPKWRECPKNSVSVCAFSIPDCELPDVTL